ncbi:hypothetical protein 8G_00061 [Ralstonia phage Hyacinthe]|uniref:Uncharacterized protein n=3 Tax=Rahariannevirus raharianne TaxID=2846050 RepID=A0A7G5BB99_9CAUD|nr:DNA binding protein [Ralstonia phage Raharianne]QMV32378.1 hypothetical protein U2_00003 [Ralstonia phage Albius]QMV33493.1 hypothetical protein 8G_00061 [Ralstonia phage Hyacinthe]QMV33572.1 hypothetical protein Y2_00003 [Ralstonia phage Raharianne]
MNSPEFANAVIDRLGGTAAAARIFRVEMPTVSYYRRNGFPKPRLMFLEVAFSKLLKEVAAEFHR